MQLIEYRLSQLLSHLSSLVGWTASNRRFDLVERSYLRQYMGGYRCGASNVNVMELASRMRPTTCFRYFAFGIDGDIARIGFGEFGSTAMGCR
jgi:hypothetical protein